jgi:hypothetical protein
VQVHHLPTHQAPSGGQFRGHFQQAKPSHASRWASTITGATMVIS